MSDINALLWRPLHDGRQFDKLIPKSKCQKTFLGTGMTEYTVSEMSDMIRSYHSQMANVAPLLKQRSLQGTCNAIHDFAFNHFQYKADKADQMLRSPACSWYSRHDGIDCKSYSIIASCILVNLGINHYIRRIKQPGFMSDLWTHVYVIVPVDQKTGSLSQGHYVIDGTIADKSEPIYTAKSDQYMSMKHYGLNAPAPKRVGLNGTPRTGLGGLSLDQIKGMFSGGWAPSCIGGTHDMNDFNSTLASLQTWFDDSIYNINNAIRNNEPSLMAMVNKLLTNTQQIQAHSLSYSKHDWDSKCSKDSTKAYKDLGVWYGNIVMKAFLPWLEQYFTVHYIDVPNIKRGGYEAASKFTKSSFNGGSITVKNISSIALKPSTTEIKRFELTPYVADSKNHNSFNLIQFVSGLTTTLASFNKPSGNTNSPISAKPGTIYQPAPGGTIKPFDPVKVNLPDNSTTVVKAGAGVLGWVLLAAAASVAFSGMKDKPKATPVATTRVNRKASSKKTK